MDGEILVDFLPWPLLLPLWSDWPMEQVGGSDTSENVMQKRCSDNCPESTNKKLCQDTTTMSCPPNSAAPSEVQAENCSKQTDDVQMLDGNESATRHCSNDEVAMAEVSHDDAVSINDIPPPILLKVFSYLKIQDLLLSVSLVCKHWHNLAMDPELWRSIDIKGLLKVSDEIFGKITSLSQNVISVNLSDSKMITDAGIVQMAASCRQLRTLRMVRSVCHSSAINSAIGVAISTDCLPLLQVPTDIRCWISCHWSILLILATSISWLLLQSYWPSAVCGEPLLWSQIVKDTLEKRVCFFPILICECLGSLFSGLFLLNDLQNGVG